MNPSIVEGPGPNPIPLIITAEEDNDEQSFEVDAPLEHSQQAITDSLAHASTELLTLTHEYKGVRAAPVLVTVEKARMWLGNNKGNRKKNKSRIKSYAELIRDNIFFFTGEALLFNTEGRLIEGQHRLEAVIESGSPITMMAIWNLPIEGERLKKVRLVLGNTRRSAQEIAAFAGTTTELLNTVRFYNAPIGSEPPNYNTIILESMYQKDRQRYVDAVEFVREHMDKETKIAFKRANKITFTFAAAKLHCDDMAKKFGDSTLSNEYMKLLIGRNPLDEGNPIDTLRIRLRNDFSKKEGYENKRAEVVIARTVKFFGYFQQYLNGEKKQVWRMP